MYSVVCIAYRVKYSKQHRDTVTNGNSQALSKILYVIAFKIFSP